MKKSELIERVQRKINQLGTLFEKEIQFPDGELSRIGHIRLVEMPHYIFISFGGSIKTIGMNCKNPEKVVEEFYDNHKFKERRDERI